MTGAAAVTPETSAELRERRERRRSLAAVFAAMFGFTMVYGLTLPMLGYILDRQGTDETLIGLNAAAQALSMLLVAPLLPRLLAWVGPVRLMLIGLMALMAILTLLALTQNVWIWFPLRFLLGASGGLLWVSSETWINGLADRRNRGRIIGLYTTAGSGGLALGKGLIPVVGADSGLPLYLAAVACLVAAAPLMFARAPEATQRAHGGRNRVWVFLLIAPIPMLLNGTLAAVAGSLNSFFVPYATRVGISAEAGFLMLAVGGIGSILLQYPVGWLADKIDRRLLAAAVLLVLTLLSIGIPWVLPLPGLNFVWFLVHGGLMWSLYGLGIMLLGDRFSGPELAGAMAAFTAMWGAGTVFGPPILGTLMDLWNPHGLIAGVIAALGLMLLAVTVSRIIHPAVDRPGPDP